MHHQSPASVHDPVEPGYLGHADGADSRVVGVQVGADGAYRVRINPRGREPAPQLRHAAHFSGAAFAGRPPWYRKRKPGNPKAAPARRGKTSSVNF